ncbi:MAG: sialate O-acetylesterase [Planctomycetes bacterium]|nr:sialate O-acetylesterase [Planctomycetota bacterium]
MRDDVWIRYKTERQGLMSGGLTIGYTGYGGKSHIGPELQIGHVLGDALENQILLIKTAWGGKSLYKDFRPPRSGGQVGPYYTRMLKEVQEGLDQLQKSLPETAARPYELAGFVWLQGWNDMFDPEGLSQYEDNLVNMIKDVRAAWKTPDLPVIIGELGNGGPDAGKNMLAIRKAQAAAAAHPEFNGTVTFVSTTDFARPAEESPNTGHGHHWFGNSESYFLIGNALGEGMVAALK